MKILVIGLDGAVSELLFGDERLNNFRRLMEFGCYGQMESVIPATPVPAWMCMNTSQDPGSLGVYGFLNRADYSYNNFKIATSESIEGIAIWDHMARAGKRSIIIGVPPSYPPLKVNGIFVGYYANPNTNNTLFTYPEPIKEEIAKIVWEYPVDVKEFSSNNKHRLKDEIYSMSCKHFEVVRHFLKTSQWDYFQFVEIGLDSLQRGFWQFYDPQHRLFEAGNLYKDFIHDYYLYLDEELGKILEELKDDTVILVASAFGAQRLNGYFFVNEWLIKEGLLVLKEYPREVTPFEKLNIDWNKTKAWSEGGGYAQVFFNIKGREPHGTIEEIDCEMFSNEVKAKLENIVDDQGKSAGTLVFKPENIYREVNHIAPDLLVSLGGLHWRSDGSVGHRRIFIGNDDIWSEGCSHTQFGCFILASPNNPLHGEVKDANLLNIAPTLLELGGYTIPGSMQGKSLVIGEVQPTQIDRGNSTDEEEVIRERLKGLGYI